MKTEMQNRAIIKTVWTLLVALVLPTIAMGLELEYPPHMPEARTEVYKTVDDLDLKLWIFEPENHTVTNPVPAALFFFGGGLNSGSPEHFRE